jgi:uncharacterized membrane protein YfbV (UPF0208 family)
MRPKSVLAGVGCTTAMAGWLYAVNTVAPVFHQMLPEQPLLVMALVGLPAVAVGFLWLGSQSQTSLSPLQQKRLSEKVDVANEQAILKIDALEAKIKTLETALSKALTQS